MASLRGATLATVLAVLAAGPAAVEALGAPPRPRPLPPSLRDPTPLPPAALAASRVPGILPGGPPGEVGEGDGEGGAGGGASLPSFLGASSSSAAADPAAADPAGDRDRGLIRIRPLRKGRSSSSSSISPSNSSSSAPAPPSAPAPAPTPTLLSRLVPRSGAAAAGAVAGAAALTTLRVLAGDRLLMLGAGSGGSSGSGTLLADPPPGPGGPAVVRPAEGGRGGSTDELDRLRGGGGPGSGLDGRGTGRTGTGAGGGLAGPAGPGPAARVRSDIRARASSEPPSAPAEAKEASNSYPKSKSESKSKSKSNSSPKSSRTAPSTRTNASAAKAAPSRTGTSTAGGASASPLFRRARKAAAVIPPTVQREAIEALGELRPYGRPGDPRGGGGPPPQAAAAAAGTGTAGTTTPAIPAARRGRSSPAPRAPRTRAQRRAALEAARRSEERRVLAARAAVAVGSLGTGYLAAGAVGRRGGRDGVPGIWTGAAERYGKRLAGARRNRRREGDDDERRRILLEGGRKEDQDQDQDESESGPGRGAGGRGGTPPPTDPRILEIINREDDVLLGPAPPAFLAPEQGRTGPAPAPVADGASAETEATRGERLRRALADADEKARAEVRGEQVRRSLLGARLQQAAYEREKAAREGREAADRERELAGRLAGEVDALREGHDALLARGGGAESALEIEERLAAGPAEAAGAAAGLADALEEAEEGRGELLREAEELRERIGRAMEEMEGEGRALLAGEAGVLDLEMDKLREEMGEIQIKAAAAKLRLKGAAAEALAEASEKAQIEATASAEEEARAEARALAKAREEAAAMAELEAAKAQLEVEAKAKLEADLESEVRAEEEASARIDAAARERLKEEQEVAVEEDAIAIEALEEMWEEDAKDSASSIVEGGPADDEAGGDGGDGEGDPDDDTFSSYGRVFVPIDVDTNAVSVRGPFGGAGLEDGGVAVAAPEEVINTVGTDNAATLTLCGYKGGSIEEQTNQDTSVLVSPFAIGGKSSKSNLFMGVFDGHNVEGEIISNFAARELPRLISEKLSGMGDDFTNEAVQTVLAETFVEVHNSAESDLGLTVGGTTASVVLQLGDKVYVANTGDSKSIIGTFDEETGDIDFLYETEDHNPNLPIERERVETAGGVVQDIEGTSRVLYYDAEGTPRGGLAISRALGDYELNDIGVIPDPDVGVIDLAAILEGEKSKSVFAVSATDGLLDYVDRSEIIMKVVEGLFVEKDTAPELSAALKNLIAEAKEGWAGEYDGAYRDDISVSAAKLIVCR